MGRSSFRLLWAFVIIAATAAAAWAAEARQGIVKTQDGRTIRGLVSETDNGVSVDVHGVILQFERDKIESIEYPESIEAQYVQRLAALDPKDVQGRLDLARWAFDNKEYVLARQAAQAALDLDPNNADAITLLETIRGQMRLEQNRGEGSNQATPSQAMPEDQGQPQSTSDETTAPASRPSRRIPVNFLNQNDINRIRQHELRPEDNAVRVRFENDVERRYATASNQDPGRFRARRPVEKALEILERGTPEMAKDVRILNDPAALAEFRRFVQPLALNGCATAGCHGGTAGGSLILYAPADTEEASYTNFYILQQYRQPSGQNQSVFGTGDLRMIDRTNPEQSLLLQYGLPTDVAEFDHPSVRGFRPIFRNLQDPRYEQVVRWIDQTLRPFEPDYGISYTPPTASQATGASPEGAEEQAPTTQPADATPASSDGESAPPGDAAP